MAGAGASSVAAWTMAAMSIRSTGSAFSFSASTASPRAPASRYRVQAPLSASS